MAGLADIDVTFGTNASAAAQQIDQATASTVKAAGSAKAHAAATMDEARALGFKIQAAKLADTVDKEHIRTLRIAQLEARKKAAELKSAASAEQKSLTLQNSQGAAQRTQAARGAAALGGGRSFGAASALLGAGASAGALIGATAAFTGVGIVIGLLTDRIGSWLEQAKENAKKLDDLNKTLGDATQAKGQAGIGGALKYGGGIRALTAAGGDKRALADQYKGRFGFGDAAGAVGAASELFPKDYARVLEEAASAADFTGKSLTDAVKALEGSTVSLFGTKGEGGRAAAGIMTKSEITAGQFAAGQSALSGSQDVQAISRIEMNLNALDTWATSTNTLNAGMAESFRQLTEATTAQTEAAKAAGAELDRQRVESERQRQALNNAIGGTLAGSIPGGNAARYLTGY